MFGWLCKYSKREGVKVQRGCLKCSGGFPLVKIAHKRRYYIKVGHEKGKEYINLGGIPRRG